MKLKKQRTAILYFSRSAKVEQEVKPLLKGANGYAWNKELIQYGLEVAKESGFPVYWISEQEQKGSSFAERFTNAFEHVFAQGYERVISIGNDCPDLSSLDLKEAADGLDTNSLALGPTKDGGAYLIGIRRDEFDREDFLSLSWEQSFLWEELSAWGEKTSNGAKILEIKTDIDSLPDLKQVLNQLNSFHPLFYWLNRILKTNLKSTLKDPICSLNSFLKLPCLRAPPIFRIL